MAVTISAGDINRTGALRSSKSYTQATATAVQTLDFSFDVSLLGMGTATAFTRNKYVLATSVVVGTATVHAAEGQYHLIMATATGEANVFVTAATSPLSVNVAFQMLPTATSLDAITTTATGAFVLQSSGDAIWCQMRNGLWHILDVVGATFATST